MEFKWNNVEQEKMIPKSDEIYLNADTQEIMLMSGEKEEGDETYYTYTTFKGGFALHKEILQENFRTLREQERVVKIKIDGVDIKRIY